MVMKECITCKNNFETKTNTKMCDNCKRNGYDKIRKREQNKKAVKRYEKRSGRRVKRYYENRSKEINASYQRSITDKNLLKNADKNYHGSYKVRKKNKGESWDKYHRYLKRMEYYHHGRDSDDTWKDAYSEGSAMYEYMNGGHDVDNFRSGKLDGGEKIFSRSEIQRGINHCPECGGKMSGIGESIYTYKFSMRGQRWCKECGLVLMPLDHRYYYELIRGSLLETFTFRDMKNDKIISDLIFKKLEKKADRNECE